MCVCVCVCVYIFIYMYECIVVACFVFMFVCLYVYVVFALAAQRSSNETNGRGKLFSCEQTVAFAGHANSSKHFLQFIPNLPTCYIDHQLTL